MSSPEDHSHTGQAVFAILLSVIALSLGDALIKATGLSLPLWQMFILRSTLIVPVLLWLGLRTGPIAPASLGWALLRSGLLVLMWLSYYLALLHVPLSLAAAAYYTGPLFIVALGSLGARTWPARQHLVAICLGFAGVVVLIRPDPSGMEWALLLPVFSAFLYACAMVLTATKCKTDNPFTLALVLHISFIAVGGALGLFAGQDGSFLLGPATRLDWHVCAIIAALAAFMLIGSVGAAIAYQRGAPATIAAFDYSYLAFSVIWGGLFFAETPTSAGLLGILMIATAGVMVLFPRRI